MASKETDIGFRKRLPDPVPENDDGDIPTCGDSTGSSSACISSKIRKWKSDEGCNSLSSIVGSSLALQRYA